MHISLVICAIESKSIFIKSFIKFLNGTLEYWKIKINKCLTWFSCRRCRRSSSPFGNSHTFRESSSRSCLCWTTRSGRRTSRWSSTSPGRGSTACQAKQGCCRITTSSNWKAPAGRSAAAAAGKCATAELCRTCFRWTANWSASSHWWCTASTHWCCPTTAPCQHVQHCRFHDAAWE